MLGYFTLRVFLLTIVVGNGVVTVVLVFILFFSFHLAKLMNEDGRWLFLIGTNSSWSMFSDGLTDIEGVVE